jgi:hypothetical protein
MWFSQSNGPNTVPSGGGMWGRQGFNHWPYFDWPLGRPTADAVRVAPFVWTREFERLSVVLNISAWNATLTRKHLPGTGTGGAAPHKTDDPNEPPLPSGPQVAVPAARLGKDGDCTSACEVCGCARETDIDRKGGDVGPDGTEKGGGSITNGAGAMATEEACCQYCRKISTAVIYKWESTGGHNCWCSNVKGGITAQGPGTNRRAGSFAAAECAWGWTVVIALAMGAALYVGGGVGFAVKTRGAAPGISAHPHVPAWQEVAGLVKDGVLFAQARVAKLRGGEQPVAAPDRKGGLAEALALASDEADRSAPTSAGTAAAMAAARSSDSGSDDIVE